MACTFADLFEMYDAQAEELDVIENMVGSLDESMKILAETMPVSAEGDMETLRHALSVQADRLRVIREGLAKHVGEPVMKTDEPEVVEVVDLEWVDPAPVVEAKADEPVA